MKPKTMVLILAASACGLGAAFMTSRLLSERSTDEEKVEVLVAKKNLDSGLIMKKPEDLFELKPKAKEDVPFKAITDLKDLKNRQLKIPRRAGDVITQDELLDKDSPGVSGNLPEGYRAVGQKVSLESIAGGFAALPLSRVDIINTVRRGNAKETVAQVLLENVLVLAADTQTVRDDTGKAMPASVVTLALLPEDVLKLELARSSGSISLALRKYGETARTGNIKTTEEQALNNKTGAASKNEDDGGLDSAIRESRAAGMPVPDFGNQPKQALVDPPMKVVERPFVMVITNGLEKKRYPFKLNADGQYEDPSDSPNPEANEEPDVTAPPPANRPQPRKK